MTDNRQMRTPAESRMTTENQQNAGGQRFVDDNGKAYFQPAPLSEYPRMMFRKTNVEQTQEYADAAGLKDAPMVINRYGTEKLLCETIVANSLTDAETLSAEGWETSPQAAYGLASGIASQTSAKDEEIAALRAELARRDNRDAELIPSTTPNGSSVNLMGEAPRRGPGRPPKPQE